MHMLNLQWLENDFLPYLAEWESIADARKGFTKTEQGNMLLSHSTRLGLKMTSKYVNKSNE